MNQEKKVAICPARSRQSNVVFVEGVDSTQAAIDGIRFARWLYCNAQSGFLDALVAEHSRLDKLDIFSPVYKEAIEEFRL